MDPTLKSDILATKTRWPVCMYSPFSRRHRAKPEKNATKLARAISLLDPLTGWHAFPEIAVDGMNGTGKSSLVRAMNRRYVKINELAPHVTAGSSYNYDPLKSAEYMMLPQTTVCENVCWDRSCYANLIFYYVHQLMYIYRDRKMPHDSNEVYLHLNNLAVSTNLLQTVALMESIKHTPTVFFVCRDLELIGEALRKRGTPNDVFNSKEHNYQMGQYHVYKYFGEILKIPTFDLADVFELGLSLGDFHFLLKRKLDVSAKRASDDDGVKCVVRPPDIEPVAKLNKLADDMLQLESLAYDYSNK